METHLFKQYITLLITSSKSFFVIIHRISSIMIIDRSDFRQDKKCSVWRSFGVTCNHDFRKTSYHGGGEKLISRKKKRINPVSYHNDQMINGDRYPELHKWTKAQVNQFWFFRDERTVSISPKLQSAIFTPANNQGFWQFSFRPLQKYDRDLKPQNTLWFQHL